MKYFKVFILFLIPCFLVAQDEQWSLQQCIEYAQDNNLAVQQTELNVQNSEITLHQSKMARYPNLNASTSLGLNSGRFFDPVSNAPATQTSQFNSLGLNTGMILYQGGRIKNSIKQSKINLEAAELDVEQSVQDMALQVSQAYLQVLLAKEQLESARANYEQVQKQLDQTLKMINAGMLPANNKLDLEAQQARSEQAVVAAENLLDISLITLKQSMSYDLSKDLNIETPEVEWEETDLSSISVQEIYQSSLNNQPNIQAGLLREESAEIGVDLAKAGKLPTITLFGGVNTSYSSLAQTIDGFTTQTFSQPFDLEIPGQPTLSGSFNTSSDVPTFKKQPYFDQISNNLGQNVGVSVNIPIWNNHTNKSNIERAQIQKESIRIQNELLRQRLMIDIQNAYANALAAQKTYQAALKSNNSLKTSLENTQKRYNLGSANAFELNTATNNVVLAESELIRAKYDYIFRLKILDFYQGKPIKL